MPDFLYIHIPFCIRKCIYCDFLSVPYDSSLAEKYIDALCKELELKKGLSGSLESIYIGGGTPSVMTDECFTALFKNIRDNFSLSSSVEITVEANPGTISESLTHTFLSSGVNRISIGAQSFIDPELRMLGRIHNSDDIVNSIELIKKSGMDNFSLDLMYGIPGQTTGTLHKSLSIAVGLLPAHISAYELTPEEKTPLYDLIRSKKVRMPGEEVIIAMNDSVIDFLGSCRYEHYEISNFSLPGSRCAHNLNYWNRGEYIGAGSGAHSFINNVRSANTPDIKEYIKKLNCGIMPETVTSYITSDEAVKEFIFLGLRKTDGISLTESGGITSDIADACGELFNEGYLALKNGRLMLTRKGLPLSNTIIVRIFEGLGL
ncbi:MAG: radical SAM family heme chaperone HemW [Nitrospirota bacterium]